MNTVVVDPVEAKQRLGVATGAALFIAGIILVTVVLPAEFAVDPLGTGAKLGLLDLGTTGKQVAALESAKSAGAGQGAIVVAQEKPFNHEDVTFTLAAHEGIEYKYRLDKGEALLYSWKATGPVNYELHAEPDGAPKGYAQSYEKKNAMSAASGTLTAPFAGIHGWYWENTTNAPITLTLSSAGFYNISHEFRDNQPTKNKMFQ